MYEILQQPVSPTCMLSPVGMPVHTWQPGREGRIYHHACQHYAPAHHQPVMTCRSSAITNAHSVAAAPLHRLQGGRLALSLPGPGPSVPKPSGPPSLKTTKTGISPHPGAQDRAPSLPHTTTPTHNTPTHSAEHIGRRACLPRHATPLRNPNLT